jgi:hypothetical protein
MIMLLLGGGECSELLPGDALSFILRLMSAATSLTGFLSESPRS